ncbi:MAG: Bax inhibitor-1 family protein [Solirubrobacteraceae bacterium]|nr:Bax inhibitor-1 family protein [Solirubrobacteraceae bacterium]
MIDYTRPDDRQPRASAAPPGYVAPPTPNTPSTLADPTGRPTQDRATQRQSPWLDPDHAPADGLSYGALLALTMALVAAALATMTIGSVLGGDLEQGTARMLSIAGFVMLIAQGRVAALRTGVIGFAWLSALALAIGLGLGPALTYYVSVKPDLVAEAAGMTGVTVLGAASFGTFAARDLARWMRPVSLIVFVLAISTWITCAVGSGVSPIVSGAIGLLSAALIVIDFNYLRRHAEKDDVIWLATGIFVSIVNIFLSLLNILDD